MAREDSVIWMILTPMKKWLKTRNAWIAIVITILLFSGLAGLFAYQADAFPAQNPYNINPSIPPYTGPTDVEEETLSQQGRAQEGQEVVEPFDLADGIIWRIEVTVTARDEPDDVRRRFTNEPDSFSITANLPDGTSRSATGVVTNTEVEAMVIVFDWSPTEEGEEGGMDWTDTETGNHIDITVECTNAGDQKPFFSPFDFRTQADPGNDYAVEVYYLYTPAEQ